MIRSGVTVYIVRHGETDWNRDRRYQGQQDIPLNVIGRAQALRNGQTLRQFLPGIAEAQFVASPLGRARETMEIVRAALDLQPGGYAIEERLKELSYGTWEGKLQAGLPQADPQGWQARAKDSFRWRPEGGESYEDLMKRTVEWLSEVDRDTVAAAHGGVVRTLQGHVGQLDVQRVPVLDAHQDQVLVLKSGSVTWI